ncbi:hypothetical protein BN77_0483 [Rhizobium mesoamericanum STM3625]|uniref:Uncharacterized protein n=1 Tax=Rhizobium mesoamericanum STM3625 TaxID=1211777 RepID=K0PUS4_9HYPH|nr:hypothetical protein BN77_0483 [Rhizobium mesoamericanum STM3625]
MAARLFFNFRSFVRDKAEWVS